MFVTKRRFENDISAVCRAWDSDRKRLDDRYWELRNELEAIKKHLGIKTYKTYPEVKVRNVSG